MTPDQLPQLIAAFGTPAALVLYVMVNARQKAPDYGESAEHKLDVIKDSVHKIETRLSVLETKMDGLTDGSRPRR